VGAPISTEEGAILGASPSPLEVQRISSVRQSYPLGDSSNAAFHSNLLPVDAAVIFLVGCGSLIERSVYAAVKMASIHRERDVSEVSVRENRRR